MFGTTARSVPEAVSRSAGLAPNGGDRHDAVLARNKLLLLLTLSSGAVDAICFLGLGKVFTAFMTGNFVFLGLRIAGAPGPHIVSVIPGARTRSQPAHVVGDLHQRNRHAAQPSRHRDHSVKRPLGRELVRRGLQRQPRQLSQLGGDVLAEPGRSVDAGADGGAAGSQFIDGLGRCLEPVPGVPEL